MSPGVPTHLPTFQYRKPVIFPQIASSSFILCLLAKGVLFCFCFSVNPYIQLSLPSKSQLTHGQVSIFASGYKSEHFRETKPTMCVCAHTDVFRCTHHWELNSGECSMKLHLGWAGWPNAACTYCSSFISLAMIKYPDKKATQGESVYLVYDTRL